MSEFIALLIGLGLTAFLAKLVSAWNTMQSDFDEEYRHFMANKGWEDEDAWEQQWEERQRQRREVPK